jgi:two-component system, NarL family, sensor histidine kinase DesK
MRITHHQNRAGSRLQRASLQGSAHSEEIIASSGVTFQFWRLYQHAWLVCLIFPLASVVMHPISPWQVVVRVLALIGFAIGYTWLMWPHPASQKTWGGARSRFSFLLVGALGIPILVFSLVYSPAWLWLFIGVSAIAGILLPLRSAFAVIVLLTLFPLILILTRDGGVARGDWWWLIALMLLIRGLGLDMIGIALMSNALRELHTARRELARLAVIEERERLSRDLHDLLGQTLSLITLKSELAGCLIKEDPERCAQELAEIEHVSRKTLSEVREAVAGYRQPELARELEGARQLLEAAAINVQIDPFKEVLPPAFDGILAWTVREGVTNVIRHSHARHCRISLTQKDDTVRVEVLNDGGERGPQENRVRRGLGLTGLRERVGTLGGNLEAGPCMRQGKEHFSVSVGLPLQNQRDAKVFQEE